MRKGCLQEKIAVCEHLGILVYSLEKKGKAIARADYAKLNEYIKKNIFSDQKGPFWPDEEPLPDITPDPISLTDQELVDELRKRGFEVTCTKTTTIIL